MRQFFPDIAKRCALLYGLSLGLIVGSSSIGVAADLPLVLPGPAVRPAANDSRIDELKRRLNRIPTYAAYRELAELYVKHGLYAEAAQAYRAEAALFRRNGLKDAAIVEERRAARYDTSVRIFSYRQVTPEEIAQLDTKATAEPPVGTYLGAHIDQDDQLKEVWQDEEWRKHRNASEWEKVMGKPHASYFSYMAYGKAFPQQWLQHCKEAGAIPHIAWEPKDLNAVKDDAYLQNFAKACGELRWPIFLRYASEMNGSWVPWHGNPALYREKFRLVHRVFKKYAPMVATVWCVNSVPFENISSYYPGDDSCDWVGINVYSVPFYGNNKGTPGLQDTPLQYIDPIYKMYAPKKPIAICEYGASHMADVDKVPRPDFAISRMSLLYQALPRFYPRIKMVSWFSVNTLRHHAPGTPNNYALTEHPAVKRAYQNIVNEPYYLSKAHLRSGSRDVGESGVRTPPDRQTPIVMPRLVMLGQSLRGAVKFSVWVKSVSQQPKVYLGINQKIVYGGTGNGAHDVTVNENQLTTGPKRVRVYVYDENNRFITTAATTVRVGTSRDIEGMRNTPLQIGGTVMRYYAGRNGLVTAMDIQTLGNVATIHFAPEMAQQLIATYPVDSEVQAWVVPRANANEQQWSLVSTGEAEPAAGFTVPPVGNDLDALDAEPTVPVGVGATSVEGKLTEVIVNKANQVIAIVLNRDTLVRVPGRLRGAAGGAGAPAAGTTIPLALEAQVQVNGLPESLGTGVVSAHKNRLIASAITVNGRVANAVSFSSRTARTIQRNTDDDPVEDEVKEAESQGLDVFEPPLPGSSRILVRSTGQAALNELGIAPLLETNKRPW